MAMLNNQMVSHVITFGNPQIWSLQPPKKIMARPACGCPHPPGPPVSPVQMGEMTGSDTQNFWHAVLWRLSSLWFISDS